MENNYIDKDLEKIFGNRRKEQLDNQIRTQNKSRQVPSQKNLEIAENAKKNSIKTKEIDYEPHIKNLGIRFVAGSMGVIITVLSTLTIAGIIKLKNKVEEDKLSNEIDYAIVQMIAPEENYASSISYSARRIDENNYACDVNLLAREFVQCSPEYFDLLIYNAYNNMEYNRLKNMNDLFIEVFHQTYNLETTNPELFYKLKDVKTFEDYLKKIKCINEKGDISIEKFEQYGKNLYELHGEHLTSKYGRKSI